MAIRIQLRRDTAANWTSANPVLLAGELGIETDTLLIKIGNGSNWNDITSYANTTPSDLTSSLEDYILVSERGAANGVASLNSSTKIPNTQIDSTYFATVTSVTDAVNTLDTALSSDISDVNDEIAAIFTDISDINTAAGTLSTTVSGHTTDISDLETNKAPLASPTFTGDVVLPSTTSIGDVSSTEIAYVNGVTSGIQSQLDSKASSTSLSNHTSDTTDVHGITDTSLLVTKDGSGNVASSGWFAVSSTGSYLFSDGSATSPGSGSVLLSKTTNGLKYNYSGTDYVIASIAYVDGEISSAVGTHNSDTTSVHGISDTSKLVLTDASATTLDGDLTVSGDLIISGTTTTVNATDLVVSDPLIYIGEGNTANLVDLGIVSSFNDGTYQHSGIARDASAGIWKIFKGVTDEPTTVINFSQGSLDDLAVNNLTAAGVVFTDGTQTKEGVPSRTPIISKTESYTLSSLSERDSMIEVSSSSGTTITIPTNSAVAFPIGASIDIAQISTGQVTIAGDSGVTVNATPGLKLRTQWSTATLFKRGENSWLVYGDLTA